MKVLETRRLILRHWEDCDAESLYEYAGDPDVGPAAGWPAHQSVAESLQVIRTVLDKPETYAVCLKTDAKAIGSIGLKLNGETDMTERDDECELGYWIGKPFWGRGLIPEAAREMLRHAFEDLGMEKVFCGYYDGNEKSRRVQEKIGLRYQWTTEEVDVPLMNETRRGHVSAITRQQWIGDRAQAERTGMSGDERIGQIKDWWNKTSDSDWYRSLRTEEQINRLKENPVSAFHPAVCELIRKYIPDLKNLRILLPSSGDNHAAFALAIMGARVTSADISERQLENAADIAKRLHLDIEFICDDTMKLSRIPDHAFDMVYTSNGTLSWIDNLDSMNRNIRRVLKPGGYAVLFDVHPFNRPFSGDAFREPRIVKPYQDVHPELHWRLQDIVNSQVRSGLAVCEMAELPALDASFWFTYTELQKKSREDLEGINDWKKNPLAALPAWLALVSKKPG